MVYYEHFCKEHIAMILAIAAIITGALYWCRKADKKFRNAGSSDGTLSGKQGIAPSLKLARILAVVLFLAELIQDILAYREGFSIKSLLPLHL